MILSIIQAILAIAKAVPVLDKAIRDLFIAYAKAQEEAWLKRVGEAFTKGDSRSIEKAIGFSGAGKEIPKADSGIRDGGPKE